MGEMEPSNYLLDHFIAHKLSELTECGAEPLPEHQNWLNTFILRSVFEFKLEPKPRAFLFSFLRRTEGASAAYREARSSLIEHLSTPRNVVSHYFRALTQIEICISQCYQAYELLATALGGNVYEPGKGSLEEKLQVVYVDSKHMDRMIHGEKLPVVATSGVWLTNDGIESSRGRIAFSELIELLADLHRLAETLCTAQVPTDGA
jgi:hypothetical protein